MTDDYSIDLPITPSPPPPAASIYGSTIGIMALASVAALFILCSYAVVARHCFIENHGEDTALRQIAAARSGQLRVVSSSPPPSQGLDDAALAALPVVVRHTGRGGGCAVCLSEYGGKQKVKVIPGCGQAFHPECIDVWLRWRGSCPVCRCSELWGPSGCMEVRLDLFVCGEGNGGRKLGRSRSSQRAGVLMEGGGGAIVLRRTCSV